ncbi:MAG: hypothetical protein L3K01_04700, partial [Thermoplasmata archaeon]|nr:hypothetical protein [Thermoplasmata archaeon]
MLGERIEKSIRRSQPIRSPVEGQVHPSVRVPLRWRRGEVRGIREDPVEPPETVGEVGPHDRHVQPVGPRA